MNKYFINILKYFYSFLASKTEETVALVALKQYALKVICSNNN